MSRFLSNIVGAIVEASQELRIHRGRVILSLIGVAVAVCALTSIVGLTAVSGQAFTEANDRSGGRAATLSVQVSQAGQTALDPAKIDSAVRELAERYSIEYISRSEQTQVSAQFVDGTVPVLGTVVDPAYGTMHRVRVAEGTWFTADDAERLAPAVVVNRVVWERLGSPPIESHPTIQLWGDKPLTAVVIGVATTSQWDTTPSMYLLPEAAASLAKTSTGGQSPEMQMGMGGGGAPSFEFWIPAADAEAFTQRIQSDLKATLGSDANVSVYRGDFGAFGEDPLASLKIVVGAIAGLILLLGALGLVNLSLVTVRQRVREIGIRRSFGATAPRVFFSVMMESVVATFLAGIVGVMLAVAVVKNPLVEQWIGQGIVTDFPPFPIDAAILGLVCATAVGAIAGLLPALVAVRVKVIDAIRY
ncbi:ABC transporter permease [Plantibacter sp. Mn2098]|uniref:ABC transporter permease n=1 Tax=Plantibacter sp. Mn2098 TaxID=3395266 RepID=UPI003BE513B5